MRDLACKFFVCLLVCTVPHVLYGQGGPQAVGEPSSSPTPGGGAVQLQQKLETISDALTVTRKQLEQSQQQVQQLQVELEQVRKQLAASASISANDAADSQVAKGSDLEERVEALEAQVKIQDQTKVESESKYAVRFSGLVLFNGFINRGAVDNVDLPSIAIPSPDGTNGSVGAGMRQTILGVEGFGPRIAGAKTSADVNFDFYGGTAYSNYGTVAGIVRMRTAGIRFDWERDSLDGGMRSPLISPLSPASYAMVAEPGLAGAGNLWTWAPQLHYTHQFAGAPEQNRFKLEIGLWDPPAAGYNTTDVLRAPSPSERAGQPGYETRISYGSAGEQGLQIGLSGYYSRQSYSLMVGDEFYTQGNDSWAFTTDWRVPLAHRFEISGEGYRGRSLGGFGGGVYKDVVYGTDPVSGEPVIRGLDAIGGWTQAKSRFGRLLEANASIGLDNGFASDFHAVVLPSNASPILLRARNRMVIANAIYRPKTYLIFSPEFRRIWTWPISGARSTADIYTLSVGYQF